MGNCATKIPTDNSYPLSAAPLTGLSATNTITANTDPNNEPSSTDTLNLSHNNPNIEKKENIAVLLTQQKRRLVTFGYARYICSVFVPSDILEAISVKFLDDAFVFKIKSEQLYKLRHETDSVVSFHSNTFLYRNIRFQLQISKILKEHSDHGFQLSARLLSKNVIITTTIALQCVETKCGYHNFVENFFESGWPSSTLKLSDISDDITELNFVCKFDILRVQPMFESEAKAEIPPFYKNICMQQRVDFVWNLDDKTSPSYRTDNDDQSLILFYESPQFEQGSFVVHFIQSNVMERDGFAVMLELFSYPQSVMKVTLKWIVIVCYDGKIIKKTSTDDFAPNDSCHSKAFSKSDFHFIGETNEFLLSLLTIKVGIEVLEIYDEYNARIKWEEQCSERHWPNYGIFNPLFKDKSASVLPLSDECGEITHLKEQIQRMDTKLTQLLSIKDRSNEYGKNECEGTVLEQWLKEIGLRHYFDLLTSQGFDSVPMMREINGLRDLEYIGISLKAHQLKFMNHIKKLQQQSN